MHNAHEILPQQDGYLTFECLGIYFSNYDSPFISRFIHLIESKSSTNIYIHLHFGIFFQYMIMQGKQLLTRTLNRF